MEACCLQSGVTLGAVRVTVDTTGTAGAVCALDSSISVWSMEDYSPVGPSIPTSPSATWGIAFLPRGSKDAPLLLAMAGGSSNTVKIWDVSNGKELASMVMPSEDENHREKFVLSVSVSEDGTKIVAGAMDGGVALFDASSGSMIGRLKGHFKPVRSVSFTPDVSNLSVVFILNTKHLIFRSVAKGTPLILFTSKTSHG